MNILYSIDLDTMKVNQLKRERGTLKPKMETCSICKKSFALKSSLSRHLLKIHSLHKGNLFTCDVCGICYKKEHNLVRHISTSHQESSITYTCSYCELNFKNKGLLENHIEKKCSKTATSNDKEKNKASSTLKCTECDFKGSRRKVYNHLIERHSYSPETKKFNFSNYNEYLEWKLGEEKDSRSNFVKASSKIAKDFSYEYYVCNRSGYYESKSVETRKRHLKTQGLSKIGVMCPASISVKISSDGSVKAKYIKNHLGHDNSLAHLRLPVGERTDIARKLSLGTSVNDILDSIRDLNNYDRASLIKKKDIANIAAAFKIKCKRIRKVAHQPSQKSQRGIKEFLEEDLHDIFQDSISDFSLVTLLKEKITFALGLVETLQESQVTFDIVNAVEVLIQKLQAVTMTSNESSQLIKQSGSGLINL